MADNTESKGPSFSGDTLFGDNTLTGGLAPYGTFSQNINGSIDVEDNGIGIGGQDTRHATGVALPEQTVLTFIGDPTDPNDPTVRNEIMAGRYMVKVRTKNGQEGTFPLVDLGPGRRTGRGIDLTGSAARQLGLKDDTGEVEWSLVYNPASERLTQPQSSVQERINGTGTAPEPVTQQRVVSPIQAMRESDPTLASFSDAQITDRISQFYPRVPRQQIEQFAPLTNGFALLNRAQYLYDTPLARAKGQDPALGRLSDDDALHFLYNRFADKSQETLAQFGLRMNPVDPDKTARTNGFLQAFDSAKNFAAETIRQFGPQGQIAGLTMWRGARELAVTGGSNSVNFALDALYGKQPEEDRRKLIAQYQAADPHTQAKMVAETVNRGGTALQQSLQRQGLDTGRLVDQIQTGLLGMRDQKANQESVDWMTKVIGQIDQDNPGTLPENQEKVAKLIAQAPAQALVSLFPGVREFGIYSQLYDSNLQAIRAANPQMDAKEIDRRARLAADAQFPAQEVLAFMFKNGGGAVTSSITNKVLKAGADVLLTSGTGGATFAANQAIQNAAAGKQLEDGVGEAFTQGAIIGGVAASTIRVPELGARLSVGMVKNYMTRSDAGKVVAGYMDSVTNAEPADINKFLRGDKDNPIDEKTRDRAKDVILSSLEKLGSNVPKPVVEAIQQARGTQGEEVASHVETAFSLLGSEQKKQVHDDVVASLKALSETKQPVATVTDSYLYPTEAPEIRAQRAEERRILTGHPTDEQARQSAQHRAQQLRLSQEQAQTQQRAAERGILAPPPRFGPETLFSPGPTLGEPVKPTPEGPQTQRSEYVPPTPYERFQAPERPPKNVAEPRWAVWNSLIAGEKTALLNAKPDSPQISDFNKRVAELEQNWRERGVAFKSGAMPRGQAGYVVNPADLLLAGLQKTFAIGAESTKRDIQTLRDITGKLTGRVGKQFQKTFTPEKRSEEAQSAATSIIQRRAQAGLFNNQFANEIYRQLQFQDEFKNGDKAYRRDQYVNKYPRAVQAEMLMRSEEGNPTGDPIYDRMANVNKYVYQKLTQLDEKEGIEYDARDNYVKHLLEPTSQKEFEAYVAKHMKFANPGYIKPREFDTYRQAMSAKDSNGRPLFKMRTTSPERLLQVRIAEFSAARAKIQALRDLEQRGLAWDTKGENTPEEIKQAWANYKIHTANGRNYYVHPDAFQVINNAFNPSSMAGTIGGSFFEFLKTMKGLSAPLRLGLSLAHEDHLSRIRLADRWTNIILRPGLPRAGDFITALSDTAAQAIGLGGYPGMVRDSVKYGGIIHVMRGDREARNAEEAWAVKQLTDAGFRANVSHERELEFTNWLDQRLPKLHQSLRKFGQVGEFAFRLASLQSLQRWMFSQVIPSVKAASLLEKISNLYKAHPELELPANEARRLSEIQKLGKQVDLRFGELNWDNVFWTKAWKDVAIGSLLSASWQMGLVDYSVGAVKDLTKSALHMDETIKTLREEGGHAALRKAVTDRALTSFFYTLTTMARGAVISYVFAGGVSSLMDYFFPRIGTNPDGSDKRLRMLDFAPELMAWWNHSHAQTGEFDPITGSLTMARNKLSPVLSSAWEALTNTNYFGGQISEHGLFDQQGFLDRLNFFLENTFTPFSGGAIAKAGTQIVQGKPPTGAMDALFAFFGLNQAPHWTQRTPAENEIIREYGVEHGHSSSKQTSDLYQALHGYQDALASNDSEGTLEAYQTLKKLGVSDKRIADAAKDYKTPVAQKLFKGLNTQSQVKIYRSMSPDEQRTYFRLLHKDARAFISAGLQPTQ